MSKLLFWAAVVIVGLLVMRLMARHAAARTTAARRTSRSRRFEPMAQCAHCGVHLPAKDAIQRNGKHWCSEDHARLGAPR
ncbi:hypothetical protein FOZ76_25265 [Verticiella sediminum]|uniref:MYND finger n=1 Tax=Verticiella sediminum TaxID=1247510 RepID=A0A556A7V1_9BURK|nr:PP0621 family protein [Verticiella sediminum]TSH88943.1 hypothetical protein FOZ76_25265 [Verticiella sediminum]